MLVFIVFLLGIRVSQSGKTTSADVCIVGSGISGSSVAYFLRLYASQQDELRSILLFERRNFVGGRMASVLVGGDSFESGASILHPSNLHAISFSNLLNLTVNPPSSSSSTLGIWDGNKFILKTLNFSVFPWIADLANSLMFFFRYGFSILRMNFFTKNTVEKFQNFYKDLKHRPVFETVEDMLRWSGLYNLTQRTFQAELMDADISPSLISELITVITRINYGQSTGMSGLAGAVAMAGSEKGLWSVEGGNRQIASGLIKWANVGLRLEEEIVSVSKVGSHYELNSVKGVTYKCNVTVIATPLDELEIDFSPPISLPHREMQHTHVTFVVGLLNPGYFGVDEAWKIPDVIGTLERPEIPFSSISVCKRRTDGYVVYKLFSRRPLSDEFLHLLFGEMRERVSMEWAAYPKFRAPEVFAPLILDGHHLYYVNAFENAASAIETGAVAAENVVRLILSRTSTHSLHPSPLTSSLNKLSFSEL